MAQWLDGSAWGVRLFFQGAGDNVGVVGAIGGEFAAVEAVGVVDAGGAEGAAVEAEGVGRGFGVVLIGADDAEIGSVAGYEDGRIRTQSWKQKQKANNETDVEGGKGQAGKTS